MNPLRDKKRKQECGPVLNREYRQILVQQACLAELEAYLKGRGVEVCQELDEPVTAILNIRNEDQDLDEVQEFIDAWLNSDT